MININIYIYIGNALKMYFMHSRYYLIVYILEVININLEPIFILAFFSLLFFVLI